MVLVIIGLVAFLVGGYVTGRTLGEDRDAPAEGARDAGRHGLLHGILTWALATVVILVLSGLGVGTLFGAMGDMMGPLDPEQISQAARDGALGAFCSLLLWADRVRRGHARGGRSAGPLSADCGALEGLPHAKYLSRDESRRRGAGTPLDMAQAFEYR